MRAFNLIALSLALPVLCVLGLSALGESLLGADTAKYVVFPIALLLGFSSRRIVEKILGYTLLEAMKDEESK